MLRKDQRTMKIEEEGQAGGHYNAANVDITWLELGK